MLQYLSGRTDMVYIDRFKPAYLLLTLKSSEVSQQDFSSTFAVVSSQHPLKVSFKLPATRCQQKKRLSIETLDIVLLSPIKVTFGIYNVNIFILILPVI